MRISELLFFKQDRLGLEAVRLNIKYLPINPVSIVAAISGPAVAMK